jgi:hypothetical protein
VCGVVCGMRRDDRCSKSMEQRGMQWLGCLYPAPCPLRRYGPMLRAVSQGG